jgi:hypothetical protein
MWINDKIGSNAFTIEGHVILVVDDCQLYPSTYVGKQVSRGTQTIIPGYGVR